MAEYIERESAMQIAFTSPFFSNALMEEIKAIPAADVPPVVHAHWYMRGGRACCSNCDVKSLWESDWDGCKNHEREFVSAKSNYCPHCGAKMNEEEHNNV